MKQPAVIRRPPTPQKAARAPTGAARLALASTPTLLGRSGSVLAKPGGCACGGGCPKCNPSPSSRVQAHPPASLSLPGGQPLDPSVRRSFEASLGTDLGHVRIHTGAEAGALARQHGAQAFASGAHLVFGPGRYAPHTRPGRWLLAHELAHVAQIRPGYHFAPMAEVEHDARRVASAAARGQRARPSRHHGGEKILRFGEPENVPDITYISTQGSAGFLQEAEDYHTAWGLSPRRVDSVEDVIDHLAGSTSRLSRIRIVSHAAGIGVYMSLFEGEPLYSLTADRLDAWAQSDVAGLAREVGQPFGALSTAHLDTIARHLRTNHPGLLTPFGIEASGQPTGALLELFQGATDLELLTQARAASTGTTATRIGRSITALGTILADTRARVQTQGSIDAAAATALQAAIRGAGFTAGAYAPTADQAERVRQANRAVGADFRVHLDAARQRFDSSSWIDIRGCNVGTDPAYLQAFARFFGRAGSLPHVSGPSWFQVFPYLGYRPLADNAAIDTALSSTDFSDALDRWVAITGVRQEMTELLIFYQSELLRRQVRAAATPAMPSGPFGTSLFPGLSSSLSLSLSLPTISSIPFPTNRFDRWLVQFLITNPGLTATPTTLTLPSTAPTFLPTLRLTATDPALSLIESRIRTLTEPNAEAHYYFQTPHVLPVFAGSGQQDFWFYALQGVREAAFDNWLDSQWTSAPAGLATLKSQAATQTNPRRVQALIEKRDTDPANVAPFTPMVFPPDPEYWTHITRT